MRDDDCYREAMIATACPIIWIATARYNIIHLALGTIPLDTRDHMDLHSDEKDTGARCYDTHFAIPNSHTYPHEHSEFDHLRSYSYLFRRGGQ